MYFDERMINNYIEDNIVNNISDIYKNNTLLHITKRLSIKELVDNYINNKDIGDEYNDRMNFEGLELIKCKNYIKNFLNLNHNISDKQYISYTIKYAISFIKSKYEDICNDIEIVSNYEEDII